MPPSEFVAWRAATEIIVNPSEYAILSKMDVAFCDEWNKALAEFRAQEDQEARDNAAKG